MPSLKVGIVDDSAVVRSALKQMINNQSGMHVVGTAADAYKARSMILETSPDVLTLDVVMPKLDGISLLESLMEHQPMPVIMVSSQTEKTTKKGIEALELGAVDLVTKPSGDDRNSIDTLEDDLIPKIQAVGDASVETDRQNRSRSSRSQPDISFPKRVDAILIGSSTGGTKVLLEIFEALPGGLPPILICQHMPSTFTQQFADRLDDSNPDISVAQAKSRDTVGRSEALLAPGDYHMTVRRREKSGRIRINLDQSDKFHHQRPAVDPLFSSAAETIKGNAVAAVLTGMGKDGADGSVDLSNRGATVLTQDQESATVYGMPRQVQKQVPNAIEIPIENLVDVLSDLRK